MNPLLHTDNDASRLFLRLVLGVVMFAHGAQKLFGWFGGHGFNGTMQYFTQTMHIPMVFAFLAIMAESLGALALILGLLTRIAALGIAINMIVAIGIVHVHNGFFMNWSGQQTGEGFEFHLLALGMAAVLVFKGGGLWSFDSAWFRYLQKRQAAQEHNLPPAGTAPAGAGAHRP